jgi:transposase
MTMKNGRRKYSGQEKVSILRQHLVEGVPISEVCDQHGLNPTVLYRWQKELFENGAAAFERRDDARSRGLEAKIETLQAKLAHKDEVIAEIMESHVQLKKSLGQA